MARAEMALLLNLKINSIVFVIRTIYCMIAESIE
jgi:hypothetical protein